MGEWSFGLSDLAHFYGLDYLQSLPDPRMPGHTAWRTNQEETEQGKSFGSLRVWIAHLSFLVLKDAWKMPFRGDNHTVLLQKINVMYEPEAYRNICAIVQSSGTGKSRMVDELAKLVYTLPINIRRTHGLCTTHAFLISAIQLIRVQMQHTRHLTTYCVTIW